MDTFGMYIGGGYKKYLSSREIENMKKNMKKVPIIQKKSQKYHEQERQEAENIINKQLDNILKEKKISYQQSQGEKIIIRKHWRKKIIFRFSIIIQKLYTLIKKLHGKFRSH